VATNHIKLTTKQKLQKAQNNIKALQKAKEY